MTIPERITALRQAMDAKGIDAYLVKDVDPHQSEYVATYWQSRTWLCGFDGSAGTLVVTKDQALLWTDSRYFIQAEQQLVGTGIELMRLRVPHTPEYRHWLVANLREGQVVGMDGSVMSVSIAEGLERAIQEIGGSCELRYDLLAEIWPDRPSIPSTTPYQHPLEFVGAEKTKKLGQLQHVLREEGLAHYLVIGLDEIAWLLNIRAADVAYNPLCLSYLLVQPTGAVWFVGVHRVPDDLKALLKEAGVQLADYQDLPAELMRINATDEPIGMDTQMASVAVYQAAGGPRVQKIQSPISIWKAIKGAKEVDHYYRAMARDGVALLRLRRWLTAEAAPKGKSEAEIGDKLASFRAEQDFYHGESFP
ncbi:MAG: aminopeptidase P family N-terminal domain-containing protein, partial [Bacteroidota bacterium]